MEPSPSRRACTRQVVILRHVSNSSPRPNVNIVRSRYAAHFSPSPTHPRASLPRRSPADVVSLLFKVRETRMPRLRNFDIVPSLPISLWVTIRPSLGKRRQRAHRRRFARPPRFLNRAGLKSVGAANDLRNTRCAGFPAIDPDSAAPRNDVRRPRRRHGCREVESKFLNPCAEFEHAGRRPNLDATVKNFNNFFTIERRLGRFSER